MTPGLPAPADKRFRRAQVRPTGRKGASWRRALLLAKSAVTLLVVGLNDERVSPWMSAKFAARLQATGTGRTVALIRNRGAKQGERAAKKQRAAIVPTGLGIAGRF